MTEEGAYPDFPKGSVEECSWNRTDSEFPDTTLRETRRALEICRFMLAYVARNLSDAKPDSVESTLAMLADAVLNKLPLLVALGLELPDVD